MTELEKLFAGELYDYSDTEKRNQLIEKIKELEKHIERDTAKKKTLEDKLREVSHLAMAEEFNCKPRYT